MKCDLLRTTTADGVRLDGAFVESRGTATSFFDVILCLHGVASNFYSSNLFENLLPTLQSLAPVLLANTRGHDLVYCSYGFKTRRLLGAAYELVDDCRRDLNAWIEFLASRGKRRILLVGHSLGAIKAVHAVATDNPSAIVAVVAMSPPRLSSEAFRSGAESAAYLEALSTAQQSVKQLRPDELIQVQFPFPMLITAAGYLDKYGPGERYNILQRVSQLQCPALFTYGQLEIDTGSTAFAGIDDAIRALARPSPTIDVAVIPQADHNYSGQSQPLAQALLNWASKL